MSSLSSINIILKEVCKAYNISYQYKKIFTKQSFKNSKKLLQLIQDNLMIPISKLLLSSIRFFAMFTNEYS